MNAERNSDFQLLDISDRHGVKKSSLFTKPRLFLGGLVVLGGLLVASFVVVGVFRDSSTTVEGDSAFRRDSSTLHAKLALTAFVAADEKCDLQCKHGGRPAADCTKCENCAGAWGGKLCDTFDATAPASKTMDELNKLVAKQREEIEKLKELNPLPGTVGRGVDLTTGDLKLPVVQLTYDTTQTGKTWTNSKGVTFIQPLESEFHSYQYIDLYHPSKESMCFQKPEDYLRQLSSCLETSCGAFGLGQEMHESFTQRSSSLATTQQYYRIFSEELPFNQASHQRSYPLHRLFARALAALPPNGDGDNSKVYEQFISEYGTSYSTSSVSGGLFEMTTDVNWAVWTANVKGGAPLTADQCRSQAEIDFLIQTGDGSPAPLMESYSSGIVGHRMRCVGGVVGDNCKADNLGAWVSTIEENPVPIKMQLSDIGELISDMEIRANFQKAVNGYVKKQVEAIVAQKCPAGWAGPGCSQPTCELLPRKSCAFGHCNVDVDNKYTQTCTMDCQWVCPARWGVFATCPGVESGKVSVVGHCGSGQDQDCHMGNCNGWDAIQCCTGTMENVKPVEPKWKCAGFGAYIECGAGEGSVIGQCGSGRDNDCNAPCPGSSTFAIQCGGGMDDLIDRDKCTWQCAGWGQPLTCPPDSVLVGECGSGRDADCGGGQCAGKGSIHHAAKCCQLKTA